MTALGSILLVEDDPADLALTTHVLTEAGAEVRGAGRVLEALEILTLEAGAFDLMVLDLNLPDSTGLATLRTVLQSTDVPIVVRTGIPSPEMRRWCLLTGAAACVGKGQGTQALLDAARKAIARSRLALPQRPDASADVTADESLETVIARTLRFLAAQVPMGLWMVTRVREDDWIVLDTVGAAYGISPGDVFRWSDSYCARMVEGLGPRVTEDAATIPAYASAPINEQMPIGRYCGIPLVLPGGEFFGSLCGIDPHRGEGVLEDAEAVVTYAAQVIGSTIHMEMDRDRLRKRLEEALLWQTADPRSGLAGRDGFELAVRLQQERGARYGEAAGVILVAVEDTDVLGHHPVPPAELAPAADDLDDPDIASLISRAALSHSDGGTRTLTFQTDAAEFAVLAAPATQASVRRTAMAIRAAARSAGVSVSLGWARQLPDQSLPDTLSQADWRMRLERDQDPRRLR